MKTSLLLHLVGLQCAYAWAPRVAHRERAVSLHGVDRRSWMTSAAMLVGAAPVFADEFVMPELSEEEVCKSDLIIFVVNLFW